MSGATEDEGKSGVDLHLSPRNLLLVAAVMFGGALGGGGVSFASKDNVPPNLGNDVATMAKQVDELRTQTSRMSDQVSTLNVTLAVLLADLKAAAKESATTAARIDDHEIRLRAVERALGKR